MTKHYLKYPLSIIVLLLTVQSTLAQSKIFGKIFSNKPDSTRSSSFLPLPGVGYAQETGWEFGIATLYSFYTDPSDLLTRNSTIRGAVSFTTKRQSNILLKSDIWVPENRYHYIGELRYRKFPFYFYGVGNNTVEANKELITQNLVRVSAEVEKKFSPVSYTGLNASFEYFKFSNDSISPLNASINGFSGGKVLFIGVSQIIDSRDLNTYSTKGFYAKLNYSYAPELFGNENYEGSLTKLDIRSFKSYNSKLVLGINANYQTMQGSNSPFYLLRQLGNDQMMRGYYSGRYRDQNLLAAQAELRYRFDPKFGVVGFLGGGTVYGYRRLKLEGIKPSFGGGVRYFFDVERGLSIRLDYGLGEKRPNEKRQSGFYVSLGEAF